MVAVGGPVAPPGGEDGGRGRGVAGVVRYTSGAAREEVEVGGVTPAAEEGATVLCASSSAFTLSSSPPAQREINNISTKYINTNLVPAVTQSLLSYCNDYVSRFLGSFFFKLSHMLIFFSQITSLKFHVFILTR